VAADAGARPVCGGDATGSARESPGSNKFFDGVGDRKRVLLRDGSGGRLAPVPIEGRRTKGSQSRPGERRRNACVPPRYGWERRCWFLHELRNWEEEGGRRGWESSEACLLSLMPHARRGKTGHVLRRGSQRGACEQHKK
jgi:hypothetical protein